MASSPSPRSGRAAALALAALLLVAGAAIGVSVDRLWVRSSSARAEHDSPHKRPHTTESIVAQMQKRLVLRDDQVTRMKPIISAMLDEVYGIRGQSKKRAFDAHQRAQAKILTILDTTQAAEYHRWVAEKFAKHKHMRMKHHGGHADDPHAPTRRTHP